jgi:hypothetical protein
VVAFTMPNKVTSVFIQDFAYFLFVFSHLCKRFSATLRYEFKVHIIFWFTV